MKSALDSRQLLAARVLADTGSFTLAGRYLGLTQSAVSHAIKALEDELQCQLFLRTGKGVKASPAGVHFLKHADQILEQMAAARTLVSPRTLHGKERLRLGVSNRAREFILPVVEPLFQKEFPGRLVLTSPGSYQRNMELLASGLLDLSFTVMTEPQSQLEFVHLFEDELRFIVAPSHPWARHGRASYEELENDTLMVFQEYNNTAHLLARHLKAESIISRHGVELADHKAIKAIVSTGRAVGVFAPWLAARELQEGSLISLPLGSRPLLRQWGLTYMRQRRLIPMELRLIELCRQAVPGILSRLQGLTPPLREQSASVALLFESKAAVGG